MKRVGVLVVAPAADLAVGLAVTSVGSATAGQQRPYRVSDRQLTDLVNRIDTHEQAFRRGTGTGGLMQRHQLSAQSEQHWLNLRGDLDALAAA